MESLLGVAVLRVRQAAEFRAVGFLLGPAVGSLERVIGLVGDVRAALMEINAAWGEDGWW